MDAAKEAVRSFTSKHGHQTDVDEVVNPAITRETVKPTRHEEFTEAVDREVHQHHYHTTVQPIAHREVVPEKHTHNMMPIEKKEFHHGDHDAVKRGVSQELGQFANMSITHDTQHTRSSAAAVSGEHVHHHVHETVQPVIHKETIQPEVVHTTIPIHEVHHAEATHHGISALPMKTLDEFTKAGGLLKGSERHTHEQYEGAPRPYNKDLQTTAEKVLSHIGGHHSGTGTTGVGGAGVGSTGVNRSGVGSTGLDRTSVGSTGVDRSGVGSTGLDRTSVGSTGVDRGGIGSTGVGSTGVGHTGLGHNTSTTTTTNTTIDHSITGRGANGATSVGNTTSKNPLKRDSGVGERDNVGAY